jgi:hypothetical protein
MYNVTALIKLAKIYIITHDLRLIMSVCIMLRTQHAVQSDILGLAAVWGARMASKPAFPKSVRGRNSEVVSSLIVRTEMFLVIFFFTRHSTF